jgi:four helix bundle protein
MSPHRKKRWKPDIFETWRRGSVQCFLLAACMPSKIPSPKRSLWADQPNPAGSRVGPGNIAEGRGGLTEKSFAVFLSQARGSLYELQTQVELARAISAAPKGGQTDAILAEASGVSFMIHGLLASLRPRS